MQINKKTNKIIFIILLFLSFTLTYSCKVKEDSETKSQKEQKKLEKKKIKQEQKEYKKALKRHRKIQTKDTRKRMKQSKKKSMGETPKRKRVFFSRLFKKKKKCGVE